MLAFAIFAVTFVLVLILVVLYIYPIGSKVTTVPGVGPSTPQDGNYPDIALAGSLHEYLLGLHEEYGEIVSFWMGQQLCISVASPETLGATVKLFNRPALLYELFEPLVTKNSIQFANGSDGKKRRHAYEKAYSHKPMKMYFKVFKEVANELTKKWKTIPAEEHIPLKATMFAVAIKTLSRAAFGSFFNNDKKVLELRKNYDIVWSHLVGISKGEFQNENAIERFEKHKTAMYELIQEALKNRKKEPMEVRSGSENILLDYILESDGPSENQESDAITYLVGGFHTTGLFLTWCLYFLGSHPDVQDKLCAEIKDNIAKGEFQFEDIEKLQYLKRVLNETLRCSVMAPIAARCDTYDVEIKGHTIPANTPIIQALGVVHQDPCIWPEPEKFDPERFNEENHKDRSPYAFVPFGFAGKRTCPGSDFGMVEVSSMIVMLIQNFKVSLVPGQCVVPDHGLMTFPKEEIWVTLSKRKTGAS